MDPRRARRPAAAAPKAPSEGHVSPISEKGALERLALALERFEPRPLRAERFLRTSLRTLHILSFGVYFGGQVYGVEPERLVYGLAAVLASGGAFAAFELWRAPVWLLQLFSSFCFSCASGSSGTTGLRS